MGGDYPQRLLPVTNGKKILFVFNSDQHVGRGHESRCVNLALSLANLGCFVVLATLTTSTLSRDNLKIFSQILTFNKKKKIIDYIHHNTENFTSVVVDSYEISTDEVIQFANKVSVFKFDINPNILETRIRFIAFDPKFEQISSVHFLGPQYFPLSHKFISAKTVFKSSSERKLFVFFGGGNNTYIIEKYLDYFRFMNHQGFSVDLVVTKNYKISPSFRRSADFIDFFEEPENIAQMISECSFCFISGGTILYECAFMNKRSQVITIANNQVSQSRSFQSRGNVRYLGSIGDVSAQDAIDDFITNDEFYDGLGSSEQDLDWRGGAALLSREILNGYR